MSGKHIKIGPKPESKESLDQWIGNEPKPQDSVRLTFNISKTLHKRIKRVCIEKEVFMAEELRALLERAYPPEG
jgi:hypothetical protein